MNKFRSTIKLLAIAIFMVAFASIAQAQATRTWVSGVGDDVNPCSRTAPCKTWAGAISKTAAGGEIDALDPGGYGTLTITKSITVDGTHGAGFGSTLNSGSINGFVINDSLSATPNTARVTLRNISINGAGTSLGLNGIRFLAGKSLLVDNCTIENQTNHGIDAALSAGTNQQLTVKNTTIWNVGASGIRTTHTGVGGALRVVLHNVISEKNGNGLLVENAVNLIATNSSFSHNTLNGVFINQASGFASANIENSTISMNLANGLNTSGPVTVRISNNAIVGNVSTGVVAGASAVQSYGNNRIKGNTPDVSGTLANVPAPVFQ